MSRNFTLLLGISILATVWFLSSCMYVWQFPIFSPVFVTLGNGAVSVVKLNTQVDSSWMLFGRDSGTWVWTWDFQNHSVIDIWRVRLPLWPLVSLLIGLTLWSWYRLVFRRPHLCSNCLFDLRGTVSNPARLCNECGTAWNADFVAAQTNSSPAIWTMPDYPRLRVCAKRRFFVLVAAIMFSLAFTMLLVGSYGSPRELVIGDIDLSVSRFVFWITRTIDNTRLLDSNLTVPSTARQIITSYQTMPNGSFLISIPLWPFIAGTGVGLWMACRRWMAAHENQRGSTKKSKGLMSP